MAHTSINAYLSLLVNAYFCRTLSLNGGRLARFSSGDVCSLRVGFREVDEAFRGLKVGEFSVIYGSLAHFISLLLSVRAQLPIDNGGLNSPVLFVDGGNSFNPYLVAELARSYGVRR
jgi:hypothetical protein